jgi:biopolymer transport protein ExbD
MAEVNVGDKGKKGGKKVKPKKLSTRVDFTPMVDLGFLLITFFMLTTTMIKPQTMEIAMPSKDKVSEEEQTKIKASRAVTIILGKNNKVFYYEGTRENDIDPAIITSDFSAEGIRKYLLTKNYDIMVKVQELKAKKESQKMPDDVFEKEKLSIISDKSAPIVVIKPNEDCSYRNLIDILDEMAICNIARYAIVDITEYDLDLIKTLNI